MKILVKFAIALLVAYVLYRLLNEFFRPVSVKLDEQLYPDPPYAQPPPTPTKASAHPMTEPERVNLNQADAATLAELPGVGPVLAERIVAHREQIGAFASADNLTDVQGIGPVLVESLRARVAT